MVLIVGAGPVGLTLGIELARFGIPIRIVDMAAARSTKSKALVVWSRTLELLARANCAAQFVEAGHTVTAASVWAGAQRIGAVAFDVVATPYPFALMLPQSDTERILETHLSQLGVHVERGIELTALEWSADLVTTTLRHFDGREERLETPWVVGCDGAHSAVRHRLGMEFIGDTLQTDWMLADVHLIGMASPASELDLIWHEDGLLAIFPISPGRYRLIADIGPATATARRADPTLDEVQAVIERRGPGGIRALDPLWLATFRINERKVADFRSGRVFLAGDAAHVHSPAGGQGMNTGMHDACNLAWKLALVYSGVAAPEPLLRSFSTERSAVATQILAATGRATALAITKNRALQLVRNQAAHLLLGFSGARKMLAETLTEVSIGYPDSPLSRQVLHSAGSPRAGSRAPIFDSQAPIGAGNAPRFALCATASEATSQFIADHANLVEPVVRPPFAENGMWLVRPDGYIGLVTSRDALSDAETYVTELVTG